MSNNQGVEIGFFAQLWNESTLPDWASMIGLFVSIAGFWYTIHVAKQAKTAASQAQTAAEEAKKSAQTFSNFVTLSDFERIIHLLDGVVEKFHLYTTVTPPLSFITSSLVNIRQHLKGLSDEQQQEIQEVISFLNTCEVMFFEKIQNNDDPENYYDYSEIYEKIVQHRSDMLEIIASLKQRTGEQL